MSNMTADLDIIDTYHKTLTVLRRAEERMRSFEFELELERLSDRKQKKAFRTRGKCTSAILRLENKKIRDIVDKLKENEPDLKERTKKLKKKLEDLEKAAAIINGVASLLGVVARVITL